MQNITRAAAPVSSEPQFTITLSRLLFFTLWYLPIFISALTERHFSYPSSWLFNKIGMELRFAAIVGLVFLLLAFFRSMEYPRLYVIFCWFIFADAAVAMALIGWEESGQESLQDYRSFFWEPFFNFLGIRLSDPQLYVWGDLSFRVLPALVAALFSAAAPKKGMNWGLFKTLWPQAHEEKTISNENTTSAPAVFSAKNFFTRRISTATGVLILFAVIGVTIALLLPAVMSHRPLNGRHSTSLTATQFPPPKTLSGDYRIYPASQQFLNGVDAWRKKNDVQAYRIFADAARGGDSNAKVALALMYFEGSEVSTQGLAVKSLNEALETRNLAALSLYVRAADEGKIRKIKNSDRYALHTLGAENGDGYCMTELGLDTLRGKGVKRDFNQGLRRIEKAHQAGNPHGTTELGYLYYRGDRVGRDWRKARDLLESAFKIAAEKQDSAVAQRAQKYISRIDAGLRPYQ